VRGLKTTYYLRTLAATSAEKSTGKGGELNAVPTSSGAAAMGAGGISASVGKAAGMRASAAYTVQEPDAPKFCSLDDPNCEACQ
jgi:ribonucleoside-diphosphate reductase alpha chain